MRPLACWLFVIFFSGLRSSLQMTPNGGRKYISMGRNETELKLKQSMQFADVRLLLKPLKEIDSLEKAGHENIDEIAAFQGVGRRNRGYSECIEFWKNKINEVAQPYIEHPEYMNITYIPDISMDEPQWNNTAAYRKIEKNIRESVASLGFTMLRDLYKFADKKPTSGAFGQVYRYAWRRYLVWKVFDDELETAKKKMHVALNEAASGKAERAYNIITEAIRRGKTNFNQKFEGLG